MNTTERADKAVMGVSPTRLPRLLVVVVMAFAPFEARPLLGAAELFPGMAMQLAYGWATGRVIADPSDKAVLLWSVASRRGAHPSIWRRAIRRSGGLISRTGPGDRYQCNPGYCRSASLS